jgi:hypothetical protein
MKFLLLLVAQRRATTIGFFSNPVAQQEATKIHCFRVNRPLKALSGIMPHPPPQKKSKPFSPREQTRSGSIRPDVASHSWSQDITN